MTTEAVARWRLRSLLLTPPQRSSAAAVATHFGAMQAQDLASGLWSFGSRLPELSREDICTQVNRRELLRTWTQRGTLHFVAAQDARWLLATCGRRHHRRSRRQQLGITDAQADRAAEILQDSLCGNRSLSRREVAQLRATRTRYAGLSYTVTQARELATEPAVPTGASDPSDLSGPATAGTVGAGQVRVEAVVATSAFQAVRADGTPSPGESAAAPGERHVFVLRWTESGWRVAAVES